MFIFCKISSEHKKIKENETQKIDDESLKTTKSEEVENSANSQQQESSWRSWSAFGMIKTASQNVASLTTHVSQSISTAIESMNIPDPEEMAKLHSEEKKTPQSETTPAEEETKPKSSDESVFKFDSLLSNVSSISSKVVTGGLDTLEGIGKKTINILHDTDPNIANKIRGMNVSNKPNLSDLLKEAKERDDSVSIGSGHQSDMQSLKVSFEHLIDEHKGLVYLEALEILSNQSKMKIELLLKPLTGKSLDEMEETLKEVEELCELPDSDAMENSFASDELSEKLQKATEDLNVQVNFTEIVSYSKEIDKWLTDMSDNNAGIIFSKSVEALAKLCSLSLNNYQKLAELLLSLSHRSTADEADSVSQ